MQGKVGSALKWSVITEIIVKIITPLLNMLLARILAPEAFGIMATVTMVVTFAEVFVESGFQKYIVQHQFQNEIEESESISTAFWANLIVGFALWGIISLFHKQIADLVGNTGKGHLLIIAGSVIPLYSMMGLMACKLKKTLNFKKLFFVRVVTAIVPLIVTIPLALCGLDYWALIIGSIAGALVQTMAYFATRIFLPKLYFSWTHFHAMLRVGIWTLLDGIAVWLTTWFDAFLIGNLLNNYYLGLYKNSVNVIIGIFTMITSAIVPVLFPALSQLQDDDDAFNSLFLKFQRSACVLLLPLGVGMALYADFATSILLGGQWREAEKIVGINALTTSLRTILISFNNDAFRAKGKFKVPLLLQIADLLISIPLCVWAIRKDFWMFVYVRAWVKLILAPIGFVLLKKYCRISTTNILKNIGGYVLACVCMTGVAQVLKLMNSDSFVWNFLSVIICACSYFAVLYLIPSERKFLKGFVGEKFNRSSQKTKSNIKEEKQ